MMTRMLPILAWVVVLFALGCGDDSQAGGDGFQTDADYQARALAYLEFATEGATGSILNAIAHMERDRVDPGYTAPVGAVDVDDWSNSWEKLDKLLDTRDFDALYMLNALLGYEGHPYLTQALWDRIRSSLFEFKFWFEDATPPVPDPSNPDRDWDDTFYWTENHQLLFHTIEYLMGQRYPDRCFTIRGFTPTEDCTGSIEVSALGTVEVRPYEHKGRALQERARGRILAWLNDRWLAGFAEWHSNIYFQKNATPLLTLVEHANDEEIRTRAAIVLDVLMLDMATNTHRGVFGVTHGRSAMKDKHRGPANDTWGIVKMFFDQDQEYGYQSVGDAATLFARAKRYRQPEVVLEIARSDQTLAEKTLQSFYIDETNPGDPTPPPGRSFDFTDPLTINENFTFWWGLGAWTAWQVIPLTFTNADRYNLWPTSLLEPFLPLRAILGDPPNIELAVTLARELWASVALGLLKEVNTYTYRTGDYILATAQDYRKGANVGQVHSWQATLSSEALVFTTHPMKIPPERQLPSVWLFEDEGEPGYWTGSATQPRSAQYENVGVHIYSPAYASAPLAGLVDAFEYEEFTHAYFPRQHFDEWDQEGSWVFGRRYDGYVALYSWRATEWRDIPEDELALMPDSLVNGPITESFDLIASGGPDNVWVVECGSKSEYGGFEAFKEAVSNASIVVTPRPTDVEALAYQQFDVTYDSPSQGMVTFGWKAPLVVAGERVSIDDYPRLDNPWVTTERGAASVSVASETASLLLDWTTPARTGAAR